MSSNSENYQKYLKYAKSAEQIVEDAVNSDEESIISDPVLPEVLSDEQLQARLEIIKNCYYIDMTATQMFRSARVTRGSFELTDKLKHGMAIGDEWTAIIDTDGNNVIDAENTPSAGDVTSFYINHSGGYSSTFDCNIPLKEGTDPDTVRLVKGKAHVTYNSGYDKTTFKPSEAGSHQVVDGTRVDINQFEERYIQFSIDYENFRKPVFVAYDNDGNAISMEKAVKMPLFDDFKSVRDYSSETMPEKPKYVSCFLSFKGKISHVDLYLKRDRQETVIDIEAKPYMDSRADWDVYRTVTGRQIKRPTIHDFKAYSSGELQEQINISFKRSDAMMEMNEPMLIIDFPDSDNKYLAHYQFEDVKIKFGLNALAGKIDFDYTTDGICGLTVGKNDRTPWLIPGITRFSGRAEILYPGLIRTVRFAKSNLEVDGHRVSIDGGLINYFHPESYRVPDFSTYPSLFIRAYSPDGRELLLRKTDTFYRQGEKDSIPFGFWGEPEYIEISICDEWLEINKDFNVAVKRKIRGNPQAEDFANELLSAISDKK